MLVFPGASSRTRAATLGWTSKTTSPAARSCWASRFPSPARPRLPRSAPAKQPPRPAAVLPAPPAPGPARRRAAPRPGRPPPRYATPCGGPLRSSLPPSTVSFSRPGQEETVAAMPDSGPEAFAPLTSHATARNRWARQIVRKPGQRTAGSGYDSQAHRSLSTLRSGSLPSRPDPATPTRNTIRRLHAPSVPVRRCVSSNGRCGR